jgi:ABC-type sugar transport system permease subunit
MDFQYTQEQQQLADAVGRLVEKSYDFESRKKIVGSAEGWSPEVWGSLAEMGLLMAIWLSVSAFSALFVMPALIIAALWMYVGFNMVYFLAALQNVSRELLEAATVDGANAWHRFRHVTIPAIRPIATFVVLLSLIGSFQLFELPWVLLGGAGPDNQGLTVVMYLYQTGFQTNDLGYASAIGWVIALILFAFALVQNRIGGDGESRRRVFTLTRARTAPKEL